jgi:hypothetical protein
VKDTLDYKKIKPLQGNYKILNDNNLEKLCNIIIKRGIRFPSFVTKIKKIVWGVDTHQRLKAYTKLEEMGYEIPEVPVVYVQAKSMTEAKQILLECDSRYGQVTKEGFDEFTADLDLSCFDNEEDMDDFYKGLEIQGIENFDNQKEIKNFGDPKEVTYKEKTEIIIECDNDVQAEELYSEFKERGLKCRISTL